MANDVTEGAELHSALLPIRQFIELFVLRRGFSTEVALIAADRFCQGVEGNFAVFRAIVDANTNHATRGE